MMTKRHVVKDSETWLLQNKQAAQKVQKGLKDARNGKVTRAREDFSKYTHD